MSSLWDDIKKTVKEGVTVISEKTEEYTKIGKIKVEIMGIKRDIEKNFTELGGKVYHLITEEKQTRIASNGEVRRIIDNIKSLEEKLNAKKQELEEVKKEKEKKAAPVEAEKES